MRRNVVAYLALFVALGGTSAYAANEWTGANIVDESLTSADVKNGALQAQDYAIGSVSGARIQDNNVTTLDLADGAVFGNDVRDGSLEDQDIGQGTFVNFQANIGDIPAHDCVSRVVTGVNSEGDHLLLTPDLSVDPDLIYSAESQFGISNGQMEIQVCNPTGHAIGDGTTRFNLLVIDAY